ncbi:MAG: hypothetical protein NWT00_00710, partial [Beijerinckiaceae bacterium]|nr:hypothetical protein [Beijerinckiaceae bacterium]
MSDPFHTLLKSSIADLIEGKTIQLARAPDGYDAFVAADLVRLLAAAREGGAATLLHVARDGQRSRAFREAVTFAA